MVDEVGAKILRMRVDIEVELGENGKPNVVRPNGEVVMIAVCVPYCFDEAVVGRRNLCVFKGFW